MRKLHLWLAAAVLAGAAGTAAWLTLASGPAQGHERQR